MGCNGFKCAGRGKILIYLFDHAFGEILFLTAKKVSKKCCHCVELYLGCSIFAGLEDCCSGAYTPSQRQTPVPAHRRSLQRSAASKRHLGDPIQKGKVAVQDLFVWVRVS